MIDQRFVNFQEKHLARISSDIDKNGCISKPQLENEINNLK